MRCSVVIPCHNGVEDTRACLQSLTEQRDAPELELLVVDNASTDGTAALAAGFAGAKVLSQPRNLGFAGGVNAGLRVATGDFVLILNNDTAAAPDLLARMLAAARRDSRIGLTAPVSNHVKGEAVVPAGNAGASAEGRRAIAAALAADCEGLVQDVCTLSGLCLLAPRRAIERIGPFDERFGHGNFEDDDFCLRARLLGYRLVIARDAFLHHHGHRTFHRLGLDYGAELADRAAQFDAKWRCDPAGAAWSAWRRGQGERAAALARRALACHPGWPDAHWLLGRWHAARGECEQALRHLEPFTAACPLHGEAQALRAVQQAALGRVGPARALFEWSLQRCFVPAERAHALTGEFARALLRCGRGSEAVELLDALVRQAPEDPVAHNLLGAALLACGQPDRAEPHLQKALRLGNPEAPSNLGIALWRSGRREEALACFRTALAANPEDALAAANLEKALTLASGHGQEMAGKDLGDDHR